MYKNQKETQRRGNKLYNPSKTMSNILIILGWLIFWPPVKVLRKGKNNLQNCSLDWFVGGSAS